MTPLVLTSWAALVLGTVMVVLAAGTVPLPVSVLRWPVANAMGSAALWTFAAAMVDLLRPGAGVTLVLACLQIVGAWGVLVAGMWIALVVTYRGHLLTARSLVLAWLPAAVVVLLAALPQQTRLVVERVLPAPGPAIEWGPVFWALALLGLVLAAVIAVTGLNAVVAAVAGQRATIIVAMIALVPPAVSLLLYVKAPAVREWSALPPTLLCLALTAWAVLGLHSPSLTQLPITAARVLRDVPDGILVLTPDGVVLEINVSARDLLIADPTEGCDALVGRRWSYVADPRIADLPQMRGSATVRTSHGREVQLLIDDSESTGPSASLVVAARDVTELAELRRHLRDLATHDPMTGARNRRYLDDRMPDLVEAAGGSSPLSVVMFDVDLFKQVNDTYGHSFGDRVIIAIASELTSDAPTGADVVRTGGDEFVMLLPDHDEKAAGRLADHVRRRCADLRFSTSVGQVSVTVSAGVARLLPTMTADALLSAADRALYRAKVAGRDSTRA